MNDLERDIQYCIEFIEGSSSQLSKASYVRSLLTIYYNNGNINQIEKQLKK